MLSIYIYNFLWVIRNLHDRDSLFLRLQLVAQGIWLSLGSQNNGETMGNLVLAIGSSVLFPFVSPCAIETKIKQGVSPFAYFRRTKSHVMFISCAGLIPSWLVVTHRPLGMTPDNGQFELQGDQLYFWMFFGENFFFHCPIRSSELEANRRKIRWFL